jgi:hypothetical protein
VYALVERFDTGLIHHASLKSSYRLDTENMKKAKRTCVIVAGMHRSGTSALTRVLNLLGCELPKELIEPDANNETGYWEPLSINTLNDKLLESAGSSWDDCTPCTPGWFSSPRADEFREMCGKLYDDEYGEAKLTILKEPRICRLLPFWLDIIERKDIEPLVVLPIRNPLAVAESLAKRDSSDPFYNQQLWLRHVLDAERGSRGKRRYFCGYDDLIESWSSVISKSEKALSFKWPRFSPKASEEIDRYITSQHRHYVYASANVLDDTSISVWVRATYQIMLNWVAKGENAGDYAKLDEIASVFDQSCNAFARILYRGKQAQTDAHQLRLVLELRDKTLNEVSQIADISGKELNNLRQTVSELVQNLDGSDSRASELEIALQAAQSENSILNQEQDLRNSQIAALRSELNVGQHLRDTLDNELVASRAKEQLSDALVLQKTSELEAQIAQQLGTAFERDKLLNNAAEQDRNIANLQKEYEEIATLLAHRDGEIALFNQQLMDFSAHKDQYELRFTALQTRLELLQQQKEDAEAALDQERSARNEDVSFANGQIDDLKVQITTHKEFALAIEESSSFALAEIKARITPLETEILQRDTIVESLKAEIDVLTSEAVYHRVAVFEAEERSVRLETQHLVAEAEAMAQNEALKQVLVAAESENKAAVAMVHGLTANVERLSRDLQGITDVKISLEVSLQEMQVRSERETANATADQMSYLTTIEALKRDAADLTQSLSLAQKDKQMAQSVADGLKAHIDLLMEEVESAQAEKIVLETQVVKTAIQTKQQLALAREEHFSAVKELTDLRTQFEQTQSDLSALMLALQDTESNLSNRQFELAESKNAVQSLRQSEARSNVIIEGLKQHVHLLIGDVDSHKVEIEAEKVSQVALWRIIDQIQADLTNAEARETQACAQLKALESDIAQTRSALRQRQAEAEDLHRELGANKDTLASERRALQDVTKDKASKTAQMVSRLAFLEREIEDSNAMVVTLQSTLRIQTQEYKSALRDKETVTIAMLKASQRSTLKFQGQVNELVRGLVDERHAYFSRKSASMKRKAALLVSAGVIDVDWYRSAYQDVAALGMDPAVHYLTAGMAEGRKLNADAP